MFKRFKVTGINENPKKPKRNLMKYLALGCVMALPAFALLKTGVLSMNKNVLAADKNKYDIVADLDGGKFEMGTTPEFAKMDNGNWLYKYKPVPTPTKLPAPVKDGYDFIGWTVSAKPDIQKEYSIPVWHKGNLNVKANWKSKDAILMSGPTFNSTIEQIPGFANVTEIRFVKGTPNQSGVSVAAEGDIKAHISGNILTIASEKEIFANPDSSTMFKGFGLSYETNKLLNSILFNNFNASKVTDMCGMFSGCQKLTSLDLSSFNTSNVTDMSSMFNGCSALTSLNMSNFNTSKVTTMYSMFYQCSQLPNIDVTSFNTENVTNMYYMFRECKKLQSVDVSKFNTSKVTNMHGMFYWCYELSNITGLEKFNTSRVTNMGFMFDQCYVLQKVDVSNWDTSKARNMNEMFESCKKLSGSITVGNPNLTNHYTTFTRCSTDPNAKFYVKFKDDATKEIARKMVATKSSDSNVFLYETSTLIDGKTFNKELQRLFSVSNDVDPRIVYFMNSADLSSTSIPTNATDVSAAKDGTIKMFAEYYSPGLDPKAASYSKVFIVSDKIIEANPDSSKMFYNPPDHEGEHCDIYKIYFNNLDTSKVTDMSYMFANMGVNTGSPILYGIENFDTSKVTNTSHMFYRCADLVGNMTVKNSIVSQSDNMFFNASTSGKFIVKYTSPETRKVAEKMVATKSPNSHVYLDGTRPAELIKGPTFNSKISGMPGFENVMELRFIKGKPDPNGIDIGTHPGEIKASINGDILTIASEYEIFANPDCSEMFMSFGENTRDPAINCVLNKITFDNFNTSKVVNMYRMFYKCTSLIGLDVSGFNTSNVTNMSYMFDGCSTLTSLNVSNFNTLQVTNMSYMFGECSKLSSLDLSKFSTSKVMNMYKMFTGCSRLTSLNLNNFDTSKVNDMRGMFMNCNSLTSLNLSNFDTSKVNDMRGMFMNCPGISGTITISNPNITNYTYMFSGCSTDPNAKFTVKYKDAATKEVAKKMVATKSSDSNVELYEPPATLVDGAKFNAALNSLVWNDGSRLKVYFIRGNTDNVGSDAIDVSEAQDGSIKIYARRRPKANTDTIIEIVSQSTIKFNPNSSGMFRRVPIWELGLDNIDTSSVTDMSYMFEGCTMLESLDLNNFDMNHVTDMSYMFNRCSDLDGSITISNPNIKSYTQIFTECSTINNSKFIVKYTSPETRKVAEQMVATKSSNSNVILYEPPKPAILMSGSKFNEKIMPYLSYSGEDPSEKKYVIFEKGDLSNLPSDAIDVSEAQDGSIMMYFKTRRYRAPIAMPFGDKEIHIVSDKLIEFNEDCSYMFSLENKPGYRISSIEFNNVDTSKVKNMSSMFEDCSSLTNLDLSNWDTSQVTDMSCMFEGCSNLSGNITLMNPKLSFEYCSHVFGFCSTNSSAKFIVNYISECYDIAMFVISDEAVGNIVLGTEVGVINDIPNKEEAGTPMLTSTKPAPTPYAAAHQNTKPVAITRQIDITLNNGSMAMYPVQKIQVNSGKIGDLAKPDLNPKYAGQFGGYFYDKNCTIPVKPNDVVTQDIELYAKW